MTRSHETNPPPDAQRAPNQWVGLVALVTTLLVIAVGIYTLMANL